MKDKKNVVKVGYKEFEFPKWEGYEDIEYLKSLIDTGSYYERDVILKYAAEMYLERWYFYKMLLFIQAKLDNHMFNAEPLGLCLDSSKEVFDIMITPCDIVKTCPFCKSELVVNEENMQELECPFHQCPYISSAGKIYREEGKI